MEKPLIVLGIETSCDDTSIGIIQENPSSLPKVLAHRSFSQEDILKEWGGVVPEIAARNHLQKLVPLLNNSFEQAEISAKDVDLVGVTTHPGLLGPLLTGLNAAKTLCMYHELPLFPVNHLYAHLEAIYLSEEFNYPYLGLLISGGHSIYFLVTSKNHFEILGSTIDDAAGEAFDKGGKLMGLGYPAGRIIDQLAKHGNPNFYQFPIGLQGSKDARLSFSGLKTSLKVYLEQRPQLVKEIVNATKDGSFSEEVCNLCASYQDAIIKALSLKLKYALKLAREKTNFDKIPIVVGGGVACNSGLRLSLKEKFNDVHFVEPRFCTDNGAMIAGFALRNKDRAFKYPQCLDIDARGRFIDKKAIMEL